MEGVYCYYDRGRGGEGGRQENVIRGGGGVVRGLDWMLCKYIRIV